MKAITIIIASALITGAAITAMPALAEPAAVAVSHVQTSDLDLSTAAGRNQLDRRLSRAAWAVCGPDSSVDLEATNAARACRTAVIAKAKVESRAELAARRDAIIAVTASR